MCFIQIDPWNLLVLVKTCVEITTNQLQTDEKSTELPRTQSVGCKKVPLQFWHSQVLQNNGGGEAMECFCYLRSIQEKVADRRPPYERRFATQFDGPTILLQAEMFLNLSQRGQKSSSIPLVQRCFQVEIVGYALNTGGGWTGYLIIADWHIESHVASEFHVRRSSPKRLVSGPCRMHIFPCADGSLKKGHAPWQTLRHQRVESFGAGRVPSTSGMARSDHLQSARR